MIDNQYPNGFNHFEVILHAKLLLVLDWAAIAEPQKEGGLKNRLISHSSGGW